MPPQSNPVNWFEIPVNDLTAAKTFYEAVLGTQLTDNEMGPNKMAWFPMEMGAPGATGTLIQGPGFTPSHDGSLVYFTVEKIDETLAKISEVGGKMLMPRTSIGIFGFIAHFQDCEGNRVALHEAP
jgi:predicted enzyme related to lactoylglutathione lyase